MDWSTLNWREQNALREAMSKDLLFGKVAEPCVAAMNFKNHLRHRMGEVDRGNLEVILRIWNLRPYHKSNGEITRIPRLIASYQKVRKKTEDLGDHMRLPEEIPEFSQIRKMLLVAESVVHTPAESV